MKRPGIATLSVAAMMFALVGCASSLEATSDEAREARDTDTAPLATVDGAGADDGAVEDFPVGTVVAVEDAQVPQKSVDFLGNSITVHGWSEWPAALDEVDPFGTPETDLFGALDFGRGSGTSLVAIDVEVCAANDQGPDEELFRSRFQLVDASGETHRGQDADLRASMIFQPVVLPYFSWPEAGQCRRGWQGLEWRIGDSPAFAQYTAVSMAQSSFGDLYVYRWGLDASTHVDRPVTESTLVAGEQVSIEAGTFAGLRVGVLGSNEVGDTSTARDVLNRQYVQPVAGTSLRAVLIEVCNESGANLDLPDFGLEIDGWSVIAPVRFGGVWGPGYEDLAAPTANDCSAGWVPFEVPIGSEATGVFVADRLSPGTPWVGWEIGEPLPPPAVGLGFPDALLIETVHDLCGASEPLAVTLPGSAAGTTSEQADEGSDGNSQVDSDRAESYAPVSSVAVAENDGRLSIYLSEQTISAVDIPAPGDAATAFIRVIVDNGGATPLIATEYRDDFSNGLYGAIARVDGAKPGTFVAFLEATVLLTEINADYVCGTIEGGANGVGAASISGRFGAPIWRP